MTAILLVALWVVVAAVLSWLPTKHKHKPLAAVLGLAGLPILWVAASEGPVPLALALLAGGLVLRHPLRWGLRRLTGRTP